MRIQHVLSTAAMVLLSTTSWVQAENLPIKKVVLSTSGMAHFEHHGEVSGNEDLALSVRLSQVNDLLKSLVIYDEKGSIIGVSLSGQQPLSHIFQALPFKQSDLNSPVDLLNAYQGADVKIIAHGKTVTGSLMNINLEETETDKGGVTSQHRIAVMTKSGMKHFIYEDTDTIDFTSSAIKKDIAKALKAVRENSAKDARALDIQLAGAGKRNVGLSYVVAAPLWKASYRMVLPENGEKGFLQGWAVLENMTNNSWDGVDLTLVSGNPVKEKQMADLTWRTAFLIGLAQVLALIPGTSRSGVTMTAARSLGFTRKDAARFSLLLGIPTILGAGVLSGYDLYQTGDLMLGLDVFLAMALSFISALVAIYLMMRWLEKASFTIFVIYRILLGVGLLTIIYL
jgi:hypothetical protein